MKAGIGERSDGNQALEVFGGGGDRNVLKMDIGDDCTTLYIH